MYCAVAQGVMPGEEGHFSFKPEQARKASDFACRMENAVPVLDSISVSTAGLSHLSGACVKASLSRSLPQGITPPPSLTLPFSYILSQMSLESKSKMQASPSQSPP